MGHRASSAAPGTLRLCFDPFGRPQQVEGSKHSGLATFDRSDAGRPYSDTAEKTKVYCVNATFANLQQASCAAGGLNPETTTRKDAYGRVTKVTEPTAEDTTYVYDVNGKLTSVAQGVQTRTFGYDASGLVRSEATPEKGVVSYDSIGSLGNVRQETQPGGLILTRKYDFAGRLTEEDAAGARYVVNCYDGAATCVDGSPGAGGGSFAAGKLTRRYGFNFIPTIGPAVDEQFEYGDAGGRLSKIITSVGNGDLSSPTTQTWTYGNLGLVATHAHPRSTGSFTVTDGYAAGLLASIAAGGQTVVAAATYNPASGLASWTAGNSGSPIVTTIAQDSTLLARPASISNSFWSSGTFTYDSAGDILKMGGNDSFAYDSRARLVSATYSPSSRSFGYDRYGNLTQNGSQVFDMDASHNRLKASNPGAPAYDLRGNLTSYNGDTMGWDALDRQYRNSSVNADWIYISSGAGERLAKFPASFGVLRREMARYIAEANVIAKGWTLPACAQIFTDVACADPDARQIQLVSSKGITAGCLTNPPQFCPDRALTRAQMAVFLVKGYKPDGFTPPACVGTIFPGRDLRGSLHGYAPWIEQLYSDGVTAGCSTNPLQFCPGSAIGEWETLVWMAKAPASSPGTLFWPTTRSRAAPSIPFATSKIAS